jgi:hypothetical protein
MSLSDECLDRFAWRIWVAVKTIVQRDRRGGESQRNVVALLTSSLVGGARQHARMPLGKREEKRGEEIWWQTCEKPRRTPLAWEEAIYHARSGKEGERRGGRAPRRAGLETESPLFSHCTMSTLRPPNILNQYKQALNKLLRLC